jgi:hypothetical protein
MKWIMTIVLACGAAAAAPTRIAPASAAGAPADAEHARLAAMVGTWDVALTFWFQPGAPAVASQGTSVIRPLFDGLFVEARIEGALSGAPFAILAWTGYNTSTHRYEATRIASTNTSRIAETGDYDEQAKRFELQAEYTMAGETWHQRTTIQLASADSMVAASYLRFGNVPEWKAVEINDVRRR